MELLHKKIDLLKESDPLKDVLRLIADQNRMASLSYTDRQMLDNLAKQGEPV